MDSSRNKTPCRNSTYGCTFATSSMVDMVRHFQCDCTFHPVRCFKCNKTVRKVNFAKHYAQFCQDSSAPPCPAPEEAPDVGDAKANTTMSQELHFLQECVRECTLGVESLSHVLSDVAAEVKVTKEKQQDLEAIVKGQCDVLKECAKDSKVGVERLSRVMRDVAAEAAEVKAIKETQQDVQAIMKQQGDLIKAVGTNVVTNAEKINKLEQGVGTIVRRVEKVDGLVKDVSEIKRGIADQSTVHWYVENVRQYIKEAKRQRSYVKSEVFVVRGYSAKLWFQVDESRTGLCIGLSLRLCRGPNDSMLQWPFSIPYTLSLIHPTDASKTRKYKGTPSAGFNDYYSEKPRNEENEGCGTFDLCTVEEAYNEGFILNDAVCVSVTLHE